MPIKYIEASSKHPGLVLTHFPVHDDSRGEFASPVVIDENTPDRMKILIPQVNFSK